MTHPTSTIKAPSRTVRFRAVREGAFRMSYDGRFGGRAMAGRVDRGSAVVAFDDDVGDGEVCLVDEVEQDHLGELGGIHEGMLFLQ